MPHAFAVGRGGGGSRIRGLDFSKILVVTAYVCSIKIQKTKTNYRIDTLPDQGTRK